MNDILPILVPPDAQAALAHEASVAAEPLRSIDVISIETPEQAKLLSEVQAEAHRRYQELEARRKTITSPLDQAKRAVDALFRPVTEPYKQLKAICGRKLDEYETRLREAEAQAREAAKALAAQGETQVAQEIVTAAKPAFERSGTSWFWRVKSFRRNELLREWMTLDTDVAEDYCKEYKDSEAIPPVPGIEFERVAKGRVKT